MNNLPYNFGISESCYFGCMEAMSNRHIFMCPIVNSVNPHAMKYEYLLNGNVSEKKEALKRYKENTTSFLKYKNTQDKTEPIIKQ